jgi:hypothetical protein
MLLFGRASNCVHKIACERCDVCGVLVISENRKWISTDLTGCGKRGDTVMFVKPVQLSPNSLRHYYLQYSIMWNCYVIGFTIFDVVFSIKASYVNLDDTWSCISACLYIRNPTFISSSGYLVWRTVSKDKEWNREGQPARHDKYKDFPRLSSLYIDIFIEE